MANVTQGTTVTWAGVSLGEVVTVSVDGIAVDTVEVTPRNSPRASGKIYSAADSDLGTISLTCRGTAAMSATSVGLTGALSISGPGIAWSWNKVIFEKLGWSANVGELQSYNVTFKIGA